MTMIVLMFLGLAMVSLYTEGNWKSRQWTIDFSTFPQCLASLEMPDLLKYGKIIKLNLIFPHFNNSLEKPSNGGLAFPHFHKAYFRIFYKEKIRKEKTIFASLIPRKIISIRPLFFLYKCIVFFVQLGGFLFPESVDFFTGICKDLNYLLLYFF